LISVVLVNWNRRELLEASLRSLAAQTYTNVEVIVVDNGSSDDSVECVRRHSGIFPWPLRLITNDRNLGFCAANNQGIAEAQGEFVALLNNDAEADPAWLAEMLAVARSNAEVGMVASKILVWEDPRRIDKVGHLIYPDGQNRGRGTGQIDNGQFDRVEDVLWPDGCAALYRKAMLDEIGGFDEDFFAYADDAELGLRARIAGWQCLSAPKAVVRHHRGATLGLGSVKRLELIERNRILLAVKLFPGSLLWRNGAYALTRILAGAWASLQQRGETRRYPGWQGKFRMAAGLMRGNLTALPMLPRMWRKRREMDRIRRLSSKQVLELLNKHRISLRELSENST
jgi:GT2 family glycosyltransferase